MNKKAIISSVLLVSLIILNSCAKKQPPAKFSCLPEKPRPGDTITVRFDPAGTGLAEAASLEAVAYLYAKGQPRAESIILQKIENLWSGAVETKKEDRGVILKFLSGRTVENNQKKGYVILLNDQNGNPVAGAEAGLAEALGGWGTNYADLERDPVRALELFDKDFTSHPEAKREFLASYLGLITRLKKEEGEALASQELEELAKRPDLTVKDLTTLYNWSIRFKNRENTLRYAALIKERDPEGEFVQAERLQEITKTEEVRKRTELVQKFKTDFPKSEMIPQLHYFMISSFIKKGAYQEAAAYLDRDGNDANWTAYVLLAVDMIKNNKELKQAEKMAVKAVQLVREELSAPTIKKPSYLTDREWKASIDRSLGYVLSAQGAVLLRLGKNEAGLKALEESVTLSKGGDPETNERYVEALVKAGDPAKAMSEIERFMAAGLGTAGMKNWLKEAYKKSRGSEAGLAEYMAKIDQAAQDRAGGALKKQMIDLPAPDFTLEDLEGKAVNLAGLKGKIVVIDFWATWCGPCLSSFPGMKKAVENYARDADVRFLFINAGEKMDNKAKKKNAADFIAQNRYPFHVLLDLDNKVIEAYKVEGIPTKFIIDKNGRIRFRSIGFEGSPDKLVNELSEMIEALR